MSLAFCESRGISRLNSFKVSILFFPYMLSCLGEFNLKVKIKRRFNWILKKNNDSTVDLSFYLRYRY